MVARLDRVNVMCLCRFKTHIFHPHFASVTKEFEKSIAFLKSNLNDSTQQPAFEHSTQTPNLAFKHSRTFSHLQTQLLTEKQKGWEKSRREEPQNLYNVGA